MATRIELFAMRQKDLHSGKPEYHVYAGAQLVGRIYQTHLSGSENWVWSVNAVTLDMTIGAAMHGYATGLYDAQAKLQAALERWLAWAQTIPLTDLKYPHIQAELRKMGAAE